MKNVKWTMLMCLAVGFIASACEGSVLFRDDFNDYPGSPARWVTYVNDPNRPQWQATASDGWLVMTFGTDADTPPQPQAMVVAGQQAYPSFKTRTPSVDNVSYTWYVDNITGFYSFNALLITPTILTSTAISSPFLYCYSEVNDDNTTTTYLYSANPTGPSMLLYSNTVPWYPSQPGKFMVTLDSTNYEFYLNDVLVSSGVHGFDLTPWGDNAYLSFYEGHYANNYANPVYSTIDYVEINDSVPSVQGTVTLSDYVGGGDPNNPVPIAVRVELRQGPTVVRSDQKILDANGQFTIDDNVTPGTYDVAVKSYAHLEAVETGVVVSGSSGLVTFNLPSGDINGDNGVTPTDLAIILANMDAIGTP